MSDRTHFADDDTLAYIAKLEAENAALREDAERYRWLRHRCGKFDFKEHYKAWMTGGGGDFERDIDGAIYEEKYGETH